MSDLLSSALVFVLLCAATGCGRWIVARLPEVHRSRETLDYTRLIASLLVTFTALVLSLLISSVNGSFEKTESDLRTYASQIIRLTTGLEDYGAGTAPVRQVLRNYTAAAIASTWPEEPAPVGQYPKAELERDEFDANNLGLMLRDIEQTIRRLPGSDDAARALQATCMTRLQAMLDTRWTLIDEAHSTITLPFYYMMLVWLFVVFLSFGMSAPRNALATVFVGLVAFSVAGVFFVILELDGPLVGLVKVSSEPLRHALRHIDLSLTGHATP